MKTLTAWHVDIGVDGRFFRKDETGRMVGVVVNVFMGHDAPSQYRYTYAVLDIPGFLPPPGPDETHFLTYDHLLAACRACDEKLKELGYTLT